MARFALTVGAYQARSLIAAAQRCINLYPEKNPDGSPFPFTYYPTPGLTLLLSVTPTTGSGWRGLWAASNGQLYGVCGSSVYAISSSWVATILGDMQTTSGPISVTDNGNYALIVDGSSTGYSITLSSNAFAEVTDAAFMGANTVDFVDGFFMLNNPNTQQFYISLANKLAFDATDFASKSGYSDKLIGLGVSRRYIYLFGAATTEIWFNAGDTTFAFERMPGVFMQYGCTAAATIAQMDGEFYWLAQSPQGRAMVCRTNQFAAQQISTFALDDEMAGYATLDDAAGFTYQIEGHFFYVLNFPTANKTWQYDLSTGQWNELVWLDENGDFNRHRANCHASIYDTAVVGDWENGNLYAWDINAYTDNGSPIARVRSFAHSTDDNSDRIRYREFIANMEVGNGTGTNDPVPVFLRWSDTRGKSWGNAISGSLGLEGEYLTSIQFQRLGMARDRVFELSWSAPVKTALLGAWVQAESNHQ
jgi:hypothetical protein